MKHRKHQLTIDFDTADRITVVNMKESLAYLEKELKDHVEKGSWLHPDDAYNSQFKLIPALKTLIKYYSC